MENDERYLLRELQRRGSHKTSNPTAMEAASAMNIPPNRARYLFDKWTGKGWFDWGVSPDFGWITNEGLEVDT